MPKRSSKRPRDTSQLAKLVVDKATGEAPPDTVADDGKNPEAVALGKLGGFNGGKARANALSPRQRTMIAKIAAEARWKKGKI